MRYRLIQKRGRVTGGAFSCAGDEGQRVISDTRALGRCDLVQERDHHLGFNPPQVKALAAGKDCNRDFANFCRGKDEFHMGRRLFKRLEKRVEGVRRQHVDFVDDVDFVAGRGGAVVHGIDYFADVADAGT